MQDGSADFYLELMAWTKTHALTTLSDYAHFIDTYVHLDSFIDYVIIETFGASLLALALALALVPHALVLSGECGLVHEQCARVSAAGPALASVATALPRVGRGQQLARARHAQLV